MKLQQNLNAEIYDHMMLMGDFNTVVDTQIDKTSKKGGRLPKFLFFNLIQHEQLEDV